MATLALKELLPLPRVDQAARLEANNAWLETQSAEERVRWALENLAETFVLSSSFGIQAAVLLHMVTRQLPEIPVLMIDTGYLFPETYTFIDQLTERLSLNLKVYRAETTSAWQEARYGKLWEQGEAGLDRFNAINKVEPMARALRELDAGTWFSGLRREQSKSRADLPVLAVQRGTFKILPLVEWSNRDVHKYLTKFDLPYHPLFDQGYVSVGDIHTTVKWSPGMTEEETRFFGIKRECGLHDEEEKEGSGI
jgi:phosphoadenosine phosphosulfate reductase